jgi:hypothetical protein
MLIGLPRAAEKYNVCSEQYRNHKQQKLDEKADPPQERKLPANAVHHPVTLRLRWRA